MLRTPSGGAGHGTAPADGPLVSIGAVLSRLREEFPEVTISKIRFLEAEGLVEPCRTPSGYRKFSPEDVERLAQVLRMQRDHYLPLKVIREQFEALGRGEPVPPPGAPRERPDGTAGRSCWPPPRSARAGSTSGSRTVSSSRCRTAGTTRSPSPSPSWSWILGNSGWSRGISGS